MYLRNVSKRWLIAAATLLLPLHAFAEPAQSPDDEPIQDYNAGALFDDDRPEPDWIPSLRLAIGVNTNSTEAGLLSTDAFTDYEGTPFPEGLRRTGGVTPLGTDGQNPVDGPSLGLGFEIMGPGIESVWGKPRPFVVFEYRDELQGFTTITRDQTGPPGGPLDPTPELRRMFGKGNFDQQNWLLAGAGMAFQLPIEGYNIKLKPSVSYFRSNAELEILLVQRVLTSSAAETSLALFTREKVINQGIVPRIELDAEIYRTGPFAVGFYLALDFLYTLSGPVEHSVSVNSCFNDGLVDTPTSPRCSRTSDPGNTVPTNSEGEPVYDGQNYYGTSGTFRFDVKRSRLTYQGSAGLRLSWMGGP